MCIRDRVVCDPELDLWTDVLHTFDTEARKRGYLYGLSYINETEDETNACLLYTSAAAVSLFMMVVMITMYIRIIAKISCKQCIYSFVCIS